MVKAASVKGVGDETVKKFNHILRIERNALKEMIKQVKANLYDLRMSLDEYPGPEIRQAVLKRAINENEWFLSILTRITLIQEPSQK